ncbi:MAG: YceI family protein [Flavobacteriia bacterium]|nr:YceI family protein [Flavobacteriia bacterium]
MKKTILLGVAAISIALVSWTSIEMSKDSSTTYKLNNEATKLTWTGKYVSDGHTHTGTVNVSKGELVVLANNSVTGTFTIDMNSIVCSDLPEAKKGYLVGHLTGEDFFNSKKYNEVLVKVNGMTENEIQATLTIMGKEISAKMPVKFNKTANSLEAKGTFEIDFSSLEMPGTKASKGKPENERTDAKIAFDLNLAMKS